MINKAAYSLIIQHLDGSDGSLVIGGYDAAKVNGEINWTSIKNSNIHALLSEVKINGQTIPVNKQYTLDTGGGTGFYQRLHIIKLLLICPKIQKFGTDRSQITCSLLEGKTFTYNLNGVEYEIPLRDFYTPKETNGVCKLGLQKGMLPNWELGYSEICCLPSIWRVICLDLLV